MVVESLPVECSGKGVGVAVGESGPRWRADEAAVLLLEELDAAAEEVELELDEDELLEKEAAACKGTTV